MERIPQSLEDLMALAQTGDQRAYGVLLKETAALLRPFLKKWVRNAADTEDIVQEILISVHKAHHTYDSTRPYRPWLFAIARYRLSEYWRRVYGDRLRQAVDLSLIENSLEASVTNSGDEYEYLGEALTFLPSKQAEIVRLIQIDGYTSKEVARQLKMKESAVKVAAHRAYKVLRRKLGE